MELVLEILNTDQSAAGQTNRKVFDEGGGSIGRKASCGWTLLDPARLVSGLHAKVSHENGRFCLEDVSTNGTWLKDQGGRVGKGHRIEHGGVYVMGNFEIRAHIDDGARPAAVPVNTQAARHEFIPPDLFAKPFPPAVEPQQCADYAPIDREHMAVPTLIPPPPPPEPAPEPAPPMNQSDAFWQQFGQALGVDLDSLDQRGREALAVNAARLLKLSIGSLQQSLRTRTELKNELRLALTTAQYTRQNPLKHTANAADALNSLLLDHSSVLSAEQSIHRAFNDLQAHQVALLGASRAALRSTLEHFAPEHMALRFERDGYKPLFDTDGGLWRAYGRYHQALGRDDDWSERLLARDFSRAYEEQVRLIDSLHTDPQG
ncbi:type VI secretion system-associated FHA domain protein TagH [Pseudomonas sp. NA-150]|uniref:type VI secretion system-associated FHA domain protein TagH n=1 Tax=Pseudomonas sp. NA-150 TaxID=3367525 RepID=UPI0037CB4C8D